MSKPSGTGRGTSLSTPCAAKWPDVLVVRLVAVDDPGERLLDEYTFNHTPS